MSSPGQPSWGPIRIALWALAAVIVAAGIGPGFVAALRPADKQLRDFLQEWLSAKNYWAGTPVYANQTESLFRHTGMTPDANGYALVWNAHPPASILLGLPFAFLPLRDAHLAWNLATGALGLLAFVVVFRELRLPYRVWSILPTIALGFLCHPLFVQFSQGQLNFVLLSLVVFAWVANRRDRPAWAGAAVGAAAAFKLFPAFLFLYFLVNRRWSALAAGAAVFLGLNAVAAALFGLGTFETYAREVVPSVAGWETNWRNVSVAGFWLRVFNPSERWGITPLVHSPLAGQIATNAVRLLVILAVARACRRAPTGPRADRAFAVALVGLLLVSPVSWNHYFLLLAIPVALLWMQLPKGPARWTMWVVFALLWLPDTLAPNVTLGVQRTAAMARDQHRPLTPAENLYAPSVSHYALVGLFLLTLRLPTRDLEPNEPHNESGELSSRPPIAPTEGG